MLTKTEFFKNNNAKYILYYLGKLKNIYHFPMLVVKQSEENLSLLPTIEKIGRVHKQARWATKNPPTNP